MPHGEEKKIKNSPTTAQESFLEGLNVRPTHINFLSLIFFSEHTWGSTPTKGPPIQNLSFWEIGSHSFQGWVV